MYSYVDWLLLLLLFWIHFLLYHFFKKLIQLENFFLLCSFFGVLYCSGWLKKHLLLGDVPASAMLTLQPWKAWKVAERFPLPTGVNIHLATVIIFCVCKLYLMHPWLLLHIRKLKSSVIHHLWEQNDCKTSIQFQGHFREILSCKRAC